MQYDFPRGRALFRLTVASISLLLLTASWAVAAAESPAALERFFRSGSHALPGRPIDFSITAGYAVLQTGTPDSSGRYAMTAATITQVATNIYRLDLQLEKPQPHDITSFEQPYFYTEQRAYYFWYQNGRTIVFKVGNKRVSLPLGRKDVMRVNIHSPDTYTLDRETMLHNLTFRDGNDEFLLQLHFH